MTDYFSKVAIEFLSSMYLFLYYICFGKHILYKHVSFHKTYILWKDI